MTKKTIYILFFSLLSIMTACENALTETNINPNQPKEVPVSTLLINAQSSLIDHIRDESYSGSMALTWVQYWTQSNYTNEDRYLFSDNTNAERWTEIYLDLMDLQAIAKLNSDPKTKAKAALYGNNDNQIAVARILSSWTFMLLTETYGPIPYASYGSKNATFEALEAKTYLLNPIYADPQDIYLDILKELREAADMINEGEPAFTQGDNIFNGDASKWKKLANSLILRGALRIRKALPEKANAAIEKAIQSGVMTSNQDNAIFISDNIAANAAPFYRAFVISKRSDFTVAKPFIDLLKGEVGPFSAVDPRLYYYAAPYQAVAFASSGDQVTRGDFIPKEGERLGEGRFSTDFYIGMPYGLESEYTSKIGVEATSLPNAPITATFGNPFMDYAELSFILSELNGWDNDHYRQGVRASLERWGVAPRYIEEYLAQLPPASEETVLTQKYIALYMQPFNAWAEYRRTGYPKTLIKPGEVSFIDTKGILNESPDAPLGKKYLFHSLVDDLQDDLPARLRYSNKEPLLNPRGYQKGVQLLGGSDKMSTKLWWDID